MSVDLSFKKSAILNQITNQIKLDPLEAIFEEGLPFNVGYSGDDFAFQETADGYMEFKEMDIFTVNLSIDWKASIHKFIFLEAEEYVITSVTRQARGAYYTIKLRKTN